MDQNALALPPRRNLVDDLVELIIDAVVEGRFAPGTVLPPERELAADLEVTRTSLRQAIARLTQAGLLASRQGSGTRVLQLSAVTDPAVARRLLERGDHLVDDLLEVRAALIPLMARRAAARATRGAVEQLTDLVAAVRRAADAAACQAAEWQLFERLVEIGANQVLVLIMRWTAELYRGEGAALFAAAYADPGAIAAALDSVIEAVAAGEQDLAADLAARYAAGSGDRLRRAARRKRRR